METASKQRQTMLKQRENNIFPVWKQRQTMLKQHENSIFRVWKQCRNYVEIVSKPTAWKRRNFLRAVWKPRENRTVAVLKKHLNQA